MRLLHHGLQMLKVLKLGENSLGSMGLWLIEQVVGVVINVNSESATNFGICGTLEKKMKALVVVKTGLTLDQVTSAMV